MPKQFRIKEGCEIQHANTSYKAGAIAPFDSDAVDLVLFHAANIEVIDAIAEADEVNLLLDQALAEIPNPTEQQQ